MNPRSGEPVDLAAIRGELTRVELSLNGVARSLDTVRADCQHLAQRLSTLEKQARGETSDTSHPTQWLTGESPFTVAAPRSTQERTEGTSRVVEVELVEGYHLAAPAQGRAGGGPLAPPAASASAPASRTSASAPATQRIGSRLFADSLAAPMRKWPADVGWEQLVGKQLLTWLGALALLLAVGFTVHWAWSTFETPPEVQVAALHALGVGFLVAGAVLVQRNIKLLAQGLLGLGLFTLYATAFAALRLYQLYSGPFAFAECAVISLAAIALALCLDSWGVILLGALGGYLAPFLTASDSGDHVSLFLYLAFLNAALLGTAIRKGWSWLKPLTWCATLPMFGTWLVNGYNDTHQWSTLWLGALHASLFVLATVAPQLVLRRTSDLGDLSTLSAAAMGLLGLAWRLFHQDPDQQLALVAWAFSAALLGLFVAAYYRVGLDDRLPRVALALAAVAFTLAVPLEVDQPEYLGLAWAVEAVVFTGVGIFFADWQLRTSGALVFFLSALRLLGYDYSQTAPALIGSAELKLSFLTMLTTSLLGFLAGGLHWVLPRRTAESPALVHLAPQLTGLMLVTANSLLLVSLTCQWSGRIVVFLFTLDAAAIWLAGFWFQQMAARTYGAVLAIAVAGGAAVVAGSRLDQPYVALANSRFATLACLAALYLGAGLLYRRRATHVPPALVAQDPGGQLSLFERGPLPTILAVLGNLTIVWLAGMEVDDWFSGAGATLGWLTNNPHMARQAIHSVVLSLHAAVLVAAGFALRYKVYRLLGLLAFLPIVFKVFFIDMASLQWMPRVLALAVLGMMLLGTSTLYQQFASRAMPSDADN